MTTLEALDKIKARCDAAVEFTENGASERFKHLWETKQTLIPSEQYDRRYLLSEQVGAIIFSVSTAIELRTDILHLEKALRLAVRALETIRMDEDLQSKFANDALLEIERILTDGQ